MDDLIAVRHSSSRSNSGSQRLLRAAARGSKSRLLLSGKMGADQAFRALLVDCLGAASAQAGILRAGRSPEALHDLRVALRRLDVMLAAFGKLFQQEWFSDLRSRAKAISARLSPARDLDVFLGDLWDKAIAIQGGDFTAMHRDAEALRDEAWKGVETSLASEDFNHLMDDIAALSQSTLPMGGGAPLKKVARRMLNRAARQVKKRGRRARYLEERDLHRLRIALKKLRYLAQAFAPLYGGSRKYIAKLKRLQERLGHLNDLAHARAIVAELLRTGLVAEIGYSAGLFTGHYQAGRERCARKAMKRYRDFKDLKRFW